MIGILASTTLAAIAVIMGLEMYTSAIAYHAVESDVERMGYAAVNFARDQCGDAVTVSQVTGSQLISEDRLSAPLDERYFWKVTFTAKGAPLVHVRALDPSGMKYLRAATVYPIESSTRREVIFQPSARRPELGSHGFITMIGESGCGV